MGFHGLLTPPSYCPVYRRVNPVYRIWRKT